MRSLRTRDSDYDMTVLSTTQHYSSGKTREHINKGHLLWTGHKIILLVLVYIEFIVVRYTSTTQSRTR